MKLEVRAEAVRGQRRALEAALEGVQLSCAAGQADLAALKRDLAGLETKVRAPAPVFLFSLLVHSKSQVALSLSILLLISGVFHSSHAPWWLCLLLLVHCFPEAPCPVMCPGLRQHDIRTGCRCGCLVVGGWAEILQHKPFARAAEGRGQQRRGGPAAAAEAGGRRARHAARQRARGGHRGA